MLPEEIEKYVEKIHTCIVNEGIYILKGNSPDREKIVIELIKDAYRKKYGNQLKQYDSNPFDGDVCFAECRSKLTEKRFKNSIVDDDFDDKPIL